jgi:hypothetical protein
MKKPIESKADQEATKVSGHLKRGVIFRCGWCGFPLDKKGDPLKLDYDEATKYLRENITGLEKLLNGTCCPDGDRDHARQDYRYQEREG